MSKPFRVPVQLIVALSAFLCFSPSAEAQITVGQVAPGTNPLLSCGFVSAFDEYQTTVSSGASYTVPAPGGVLTSWSTNAGAGAGQTLGLKVFRPVSPATFQVVGHDGPRPLAPSILNTFPVSIPVRAGDIVGLVAPPGAGGGIPTACEFETGRLADRIGFRKGEAPDGTIFTQEEEETGSRVNVAATLLPPPVVSAVSPATGSIKGGTNVVVAGANFAGVQSVVFGASAAKAFTVDSEGQITATAPASPTLSKAPITVTTVAGVASSIQTFAYEGCKVPKLSGKKLKVVKRALKKADCKLGNVKTIGDATAKAGRVVKQQPKQGGILAPGSRVSVKLG